MSSGDGNIFEDVLDGATQAATLGQVKYKADGFKVKDNIIDLFTQVSTGGMVGYGDGKAKAGKQGQAIIDAGNKTLVPGIKEITGATAAEEANNLARQQFEESTADALANRQKSILQNQQNQIAASLGAGPTSVKRATTNKTATPLGGTKDFLGL